MSKLKNVRILDYDGERGILTVVGRMQEIDCVLAWVRVRSLHSVGSLSCVVLKGTGDVVEGLGILVWLGILCLAKSVFSSSPIHFPQSVNNII